MIVAIVVLVVLVGLVVLAGIASSIKIVREYQRVVLFRLGRANSARGPGLIFINPIIDRISWVDLRERYLGDPAPDGDHPGQRCNSDRLHHFLQGARPAHLRPVRPGFQRGRHQHRFHHFAFGSR